MSRLSETVAKKSVGFIGKRVLICCLIVVIYVFFWRPIRVAVTEHLVYPTIAHIDDAGDDFVASFGNGALSVNYTYGDVAKELTYRPQFGFFFLVALMALLFVSDAPRHYYLLGGIHLGATVLTYLFLIAGALGWGTGFIVVDLLSGYLTPALSLALVPLVVQGIVK